MSVGTALSPGGFLGRPRLAAFQRSRCLGVSGRNRSGVTPWASRSVPPRNRSRPSSSFWSAFLLGVAIKCPRTESTSTLSLCPPAIEPASAPARMPWRFEGNVATTATLRFRPRWRSHSAYRPPRVAPANGSGLVRSRPARRAGPDELRLSFFGPIIIVSPAGSKVLAVVGSPRRLPRRD